MGWSTSPAPRVGAQRAPVVVRVGRRRAVQVEDAAAHVGVGRRRHLHARRRGAPRGPRARPPGPPTDIALCASKNASPSPGVCQSWANCVPLVVGVDDVGRRRRPTSAPGRRGRWRSGSVRTAPQSWPDEVDRLVDPVELAEQPVDVVVLGGAEAGRSRVAEPGQRQGDGPAVDAFDGCHPRWQRSRGRRARRRSRRGRYRRGQTAPVAPISTRALGRTLLARQHLLDRTDLAPRVDWWSTSWGCRPRSRATPTSALWSRLDGFEPADLEAALLDRSLVRMVAMRGTIHLLTRGRRAGPASPLPAGAGRGDGPPLPAQGRARRGRPAARRARSPRKLLVEPPSVPRLRAALAERFPEHDPAALAFACRNTVPLVQAPPRGLWTRAGAVTYVAAEHWLGAIQRHGRPSTTLPSATCGRSGRPPWPTSPRGPGSPDSARCSNGWGRSSAPGPTSTGASCSTSPTVRSRTRTCRRPSGSCPSTTTCCSPTPIAAGSRAGSRPACTRPTRRASGTCSSTAACRPPGGSTKTGARPGGVTVLHAGLSRKDRSAVEAEAARAMPLLAHGGRGGRSARPRRLTTVPLIAPTLGSR